MIRVFRGAILGLLALGLMTGCAPMRVIETLTPETGYTATSEIGYGEAERLTLDLYAPDEPAPPEGRPVLVFFYGGSWQTGERTDYRFVAQAFAARGIVTVLADYRLYPEVEYPEFVEDTAAAVAWVHENIGQYGGDPKRLFLLGHSAGAYNAAMVAMDDRWLAPHGFDPGIILGWIGLAGPYDFLPITGEDIQPIFDAPHTPPSAMPITHAGPGDPPALLISGASDEMVNPRRNTRGLARRLQENGVPARVILYQNVNHAMLVGALARPLRWIAPVRRDILHFIQDHNDETP